MTTEEQQQVNEQVMALRAYYERQCGNLASEGATVAAQLQSALRQLNAAQEKLKALEPKPESNVVPITEPVA